MDATGFYKSKHRLVFVLPKWKIYNATFNNISAISWQSVLLVEETGGDH
jgi:hypothetical protein